MTKPMIDGYPASFGLQYSTIVVGSYKTVNPQVIAEDTQTGPAITVLAAGVGVTVACYPYETESGDREASGTSFG